MTTIDTTTDAVAAAPARPVGTRLRWAVADTLAITGRSLRHWAAKPGEQIVGLLFPVLVVLMFAGLFGGAIESSIGGAGGGSYVDFLIPGALAMTMLFGLEATMLAVTTDADKGVTDRFRSLPMSGVAVVAGRCVADLLGSVAALAIMIGAGLALGWRWHDGVGSALAAVGLLLLLRVALLWVGIWLGLVVKGPASVVAVQILVWPVLFLSNTFVDTSTMPGWLAAIANANPLAATAAATRDLFGNPGAAEASFLTDHALLLAIAWPVVLTAVFLPLSVRTWRSLSR